MLNSDCGVWKLMPYRKKKVWAGNRLCLRYGGERIGEAYLLSAVKTASSKLVDGGNFCDLWHSLGYGEKPFPLLLKAIDAADALSIQVHPGSRGDEAICGKDELWLIDHVYDNAVVYIGFSRDVTEAMCRDCCERGTLSSLLRPVSVAPGDVLWIPGGTVHGAKGISFYEVQTNYDVTYRLDDYGRGRELHWDEAFAALNFSAGTLLRGSFGKEGLFLHGGSVPFDLEPIVFCGDFCRREETPWAFFVLDGYGFCGGTFFAPGDCFFVNRHVNATFAGSGRILRLGSLC